MSHFFLKIVTYRGLWGCHSLSITQNFNKINLKKPAPASFLYIFHILLAFLMNNLHSPLRFTKKIVLKLDNNTVSKLILIITK